MAIERTSEEEGQPGIPERRLGAREELVDILALSLPGRDLCPEERKLAL
jgi:hypothetical protein